MKSTTHNTFTYIINRFEKVRYVLIEHSLKIISEKKGVWVKNNLKSIMAGKLPFKCNMLQKHHIVRNLMTYFDQYK